ncbi:hypothetical protein BZA05DRAFT_442775 [Tricharina praecox]|uniref:uncharacterized protein n=1 Tax=Tricharina praecox TaxID=43433 RepID=UPI0022201EC9|nr:uncharacterized protein BZA05DRAFT_442775 [Tricharina praecox]KAI5856117.1 hypothetical protein BZA05DRAFT_442775 [Tricharina praecox]
MRLAPFLLSLLVGIPSITVAVPIVDTNPAVEALEMAAMPYFELLQLPMDFDMSNPALNITYLLELKAKDPNAELPQLPADLPIISVPNRLKDGNDFGSAVEDKIVCETDKRASPFHEYVWKNAKALKDIGNSWCCQSSLTAPCTKMTSFANAATDICGARGSCVRCNWAGNANYLIAFGCLGGGPPAINNIWCGGYVRKTISTFNPYTVDVNVYTLKNKK